MKKITKNRPIWKAYIRLAVVLAVAWLSGGAQVFWELLCKVQQQHKLHYYKTKTGSSYKFPFRSAYFFKIKKGKESLPTFPFQMSQFPLAHFAQWMRETSDEIRFAWSNSLNNRKRIKEAFSQAYFSVPHADLLLTAMGTLSIAWFVRRSLHRYKNANDLPLSFFEGRQKKLKGLAVSVNDSDNIRFYHQPHFYSLFKPNLSRQDLKYHTINIRLAGIDAPEMAHFGTKSQPYAAEAKEWLTKFVQGRKVCIQLHRIDQYGRAVSTVWVHRRRWPWLWWPVWWNVSLEMVRAGFATIYRDTGAEYGGILKDLETSEARAKKCKTGMWAQSHTEYQSPGDFKRMNRLQAALRNSEDQQQKTSRVDFISESQKNTRLKSAWQ